ncbi:ribokinase [Mucilaginibacter sp.]|uniref:ribokinase n=1 Tax=Mucilaginibacter sp. TaxID=1882438 RepID=UPI0026190CC6|nr:ribokinase [Mucilaginibacter sp.]MDB4921923.1 rbsK [Mucilaginibacter sp.]
MKPFIVVIGSSNTDMVIKAGRLPAPGETVLGGTFMMNAGGKGANQAVAAARLGGNVVFIAKTGEDIFGKQAIELFKQEGIDPGYIIPDAENPSGVALITVDANGENCIVVASGANAALKPADLQKAKHIIENAALILIQLEIPFETVEYVVNLAAEKSVKVMLNPAPAYLLPDELLRKISIITPNETEAGLLSGIKVINRQSAEAAARLLAAKGVETVIITMGAEGALLLHDGVCHFFEAPVCNAIDTTAAGDVFNGALAVALFNGKGILEAVPFAVRAASISVCRMGAQSSAPYLDELNAF